MVEPLIAKIAPSLQGIEFNTLIPPLRALEVCHLDDINFEFTSSFVLPDAASQLKDVKRILDSNPDAPLSIFGHADPVGTEDFNKKLSGRRAIAVYAMLTRKENIWEELYTNPIGTDDWQRKPIQSMLETIGYDPGPIDGIVGRRTKAALRSFQANNGLPQTGSPNRGTRSALFLEYMDVTCVDAEGNPFELANSNFLGKGKDPKGKADVQGCSEFNPVMLFSEAQNRTLSQPKNKNQRDFENAINRRVSIIFFDPVSYIFLESWPCPRTIEGITGCKKRFWSDAEDRGEFGPVRRLYKDTHDSFRCRFYDRIVNTIPAYVPQSGLNRRLIARWSKNEILPIQNSSFPPATPPTDVIPDNAQVELMAETQGVPDGVKAKIEICHAETDLVIPDGALVDLEVRGNRVIDTTTNASPIFSFESNSLPYRHWANPFFYFKVIIENEGLHYETPKNYNENPRDVLRINWWHVSVSDAVADTPAGGNLTTQDEMNEVANLHSLNPHRKIGTTAFNSNIVPTSHWGSVLRNAYSYHHASHGDVVCRIDNDSFEDTDGDNIPDQCPNDPLHPGRSVVVLGDSNFGDNEVGQINDIPSTPRYLVYFNTCVAGWEPSLADALIARDTRNVIAFRKYIPDGDAREMARQIYRKWVQIYKCDPEKIAQVFFSVAPAFFKTMRPILFGADGGPALADAEIAAKAIEGALGVLV